MAIKHANILAVSFATVSVMLTGCNTQPAQPLSPVASEAYVSKLSDAIDVKLPAGVKAGTERTQTYLYWNRAAENFVACATVKSLNDPQIANNYVSAAVLKNIREIPSKNVDPEAIAAINKLLTVENNAAIAANNSIDGYRRDYQDSASGILAGGFDGIHQLSAVRDATDIEIETTRQKLASRYKLDFKPIAIGKDSCMSIALRL